MNDARHQDTAPTPAARRARRPRATAAETPPKLTHPERRLWPGNGPTKGDLAAYLQEMAPLILPQVAGRPLTLLRCPSGIEEGCFFQKHPMAGLPAGVRKVGIAGEAKAMLAIDDAAGLLGLVQMGVIELHPWGSRIVDPDRPDRLIFDLDPGEGVGWDELCEGAILIRERLATRGLKSVAKSSGGKGLHVVAPLVPAVGWEEAKAFCHGFALDLAQADRRFTARAAKTDRPGRIFIDYLRNSRGNTAVAAYSPRARAGAPVAVPLSWEEVASGVRPDADVLTLKGRPPSRGNPWPDLDEIARRLPR